MANQWKQLRNGIIIAILTGILSFLGSGLGIYLTSLEQRKTWEREVNYAQQQTIFNKKIDLIERTTKILNKAQSAWAISLNYDDVATEPSSKFKFKDSLEEYKKYLKETYPAQKELAELTSEFTSVMSLNVIFFGPKTKAVADKFQISENPWWAEDPNLYSELLDTMGEELDEGY